jgi:hypothetical protein
MSLTTNYLNTEEACKFLQSVHPHSLKYISPKLAMSIVHTILYRQEQRVERIFGVDRGDRIISSNRSELSLVESFQNIEKIIHLAQGRLV